MMKWLLTLPLLLLVGVVLGGEFTGYDEDKYVISYGRLLEPEKKGQNYRLETKIVKQESDEGKEEQTIIYLLAFNDKSKQYEDIKKKLPTMVTKDVAVLHRKGYFEFGSTKGLLSEDIKPKKP